MAGLSSAGTADAGEALEEDMDVDKMAAEATSMVSDS